MDADAPLAEVFIGRQPILDRDQVTVGYELLFRDSLDNTANVANGCSATADVVCKAFAELGLATALGPQRAFINVEAKLLFDDAIELLPSNQAVLEIKLTNPISDEMLARCQRLRELGYELSIAGGVGASGWAKPLLELASFARIDVNEMAPSALPAAVAELKGPARKLIASRVESVETMKQCKEAGFDYFQGYYFAKPVIIEGRKLDASTLGLVQLVNLLNDDADIAVLERAFKGEPALTVNLLRLTNSVGAGLAVKVGSLRHAITILGRKQLQRWLQLLLFSHPGSQAGIAGNPLMQWAALRGLFMELLAGRCYPAKRELRERAFLTGVMSLMPAALGIPMAEILAQIGVAPIVAAALAKHEGELGMLLELTERYDDNDMEGTVAIFRHVGGRLTLNSLSLCLAEAIAWVQQLTTEAS